jgi:excinuclease ABC subunit A
MYSPGFFPQGYLGKPGNGGYDMVQALAKRYGFDPALTPWNRMSEAAQRAFLFGDPEPLTVAFRSRSGRERARTVTYRGFYGFVGDWDVGGTYTTASACPECRGARLRPEYAVVRLAGHTIDELRRMPLVRLHEALHGVGEGNAAPPSCRSSGETIRRRLGFLCQVGLGYLDLGRVASTLSAGEAQRARLSGMLGSGLTSLTILLDEPSRGMHPREVGALAGALEEMRDQGNTVVVVEHDLELVGRADHVIELGPGPGRQGGRVVAQGSPAKLAGLPSATGKWLAKPPGRRAVQAPQRRPARGTLVIRAPRENNLDGADVRIPLGVLTGVCGVSGSGKSTLCIDILARALVPAKITTSVAREPLAPGRHDAIEGAPERTLVLDQVARGVGSPWRFLGLDAAFAALYSQSPSAIGSGLSAETLKRGCTACRGRGHQELDMGFLPSVRVSCDACEGTGMPLETRELEVRGHALPELIRMDFEAVRSLWSDETRVSASLAAACAVGLGYLVLGQPAESLSGGEMQRLRVAAELARRPGVASLYILDEPTVGQHQDDVLLLSGVLHGLVGEGHSVLIVEHHPLLLASCDWLIELGPGAGPEGGRVIAQGTPEEIASLDTPTAPYVRRALEQGVPS